jgi:hypothetical protein
MGEPEHVINLRKAFPGEIWIRDDGAFHVNPEGPWKSGIRWQPGDVEADPAQYTPGGLVEDGLLRMFDDIEGRSKVALKLSQLIAVTEYIKAESQKDPAQ